MVDHSRTRFSSTPKCLAAALLEWSSAYPSTFSLNAASKEGVESIARRQRGRLYTSAHATVHMFKCGYCSRAATITLSSSSVRRLFEGSVYSGVAFIQGNTVILYSVKHYLEKPFEHKNLDLVNILCYSVYHTAPLLSLPFCDLLPGKRGGGITMSTCTFTSQLTPPPSHAFAY